MEIKVAKYAGFCMGVDLALKKLDYAIANSEENVRVATLGPIIHNPQVLQEYEGKKVLTLKDVNEIENDMYVIIRAHGIRRSDELIARSKALRVIDATCPKVKKAQLAVEKATKMSPKNSVLLLYGEEEHPEVQGLISYSAIPFIVFSNPEEVLEKLDTLPENFVLASQTTQDNDIFLEFANTLSKSTKGTLAILNTICDATKERQEAVRELADEVDLFIVIGGKTSGNTRRLAEIASSFNIPTMHIETLSELNIEKLQRNFKIALTAGASTPKRYIEEVKNFLEAYALQ